LISDIEYAWQRVIDYQENIVEGHKKMMALYICLLFLGVIVAVCFWDYYRKKL